MKNLIVIEDIVELRRQQGIEDVELREQIRGLRVGDLVRLTLLGSGTAAETLAVRITSIRGGAFRGKLADSPVLSGLLPLREGFPLAFTADHIHSVAKRRPDGDVVNGRRPAAAGSAAFRTPPRSGA